MYRFLYRIHRVVLMAAALALAALFSGPAKSEVDRGGVPGPGGLEIRTACEAEARQGVVDPGAPRGEAPVIAIAIASGS